MQTFRNVHWCNPEKDWNNLLYIEQIIDYVQVDKLPPVSFANRPIDQTLHDGKGEAQKS